MSIIADILTIILVLISVFLILVVLMQKGSANGGMGAAMGGSFLEECTPGYYNREGQPSRGVSQNSPYIPGINAFNQLLARWRDKGELEGMELD